MERLRAIHTCTLEHLISVHVGSYIQIKRSHSIHMLSIQIDTKILELVILPSVQQHQIVLFCKPYVHLIDTAVRLLDTLEDSA